MIDCHGTERIIKKMKKLSSRGSFQRGILNGVLRLKDPKNVRARAKEIKKGKTPLRSFGRER